MTVAQTHIPDHAKVDQPNYCFSLLVSGLASATISSESTRVPSMITPHKIGYLLTR